jgi:hypothetical protein
MKPIQFTILRYVHDAMTGEFANIGVVVYSPGEFLGALFHKRVGRLNAMFSNVDKDHFKSLLGFMERRFAKLSGELDGELLQRAGGIEAIVASVLPADDSALQWAPIGGGLTDNPAAELKRLFARLVTRYDDDQPKNSRNDDDVWRSFNTVLREKGVSNHLTEKKISTPTFEHLFEHALKNGVWNLLQPVSLDYQDPNHIVDKGSIWLGRGSALQDANDDHKIWFLIGEPETEKSKRAAEKAMNLMTKIGPRKIEIVREHEREAFSMELADLVKRHQDEEI